jgi:hypothetical protein
MDVSHNQILCFLKGNPFIPGSFYNMVALMLHMPILDSFLKKLWPNPEMAQNFV